MPIRVNGDFIAQELTKRKGNAFAARAGGLLVQYSGDAAMFRLSASTQLTDAQYEYYDYSVATDEVTNGAVSSYSGGVTTLTTGASTYLGYFNSVKAAGLYTVPSRFTSGTPTSVYEDALNEYLEGNGFSSCSIVTTPPCSD